MVEPFSIVKAADISPVALGKSTSVVVKGLLVIVGVGLILWMGWVTFVRPHVVKPNPTSTTNQSGTICNNYNNPTPKEIEDMIADRVTKEINKQRNRRWFGFYIKGVDIGVTQ